MQAQDRALSRVPVEVWHDIFEFVTSVPRKYEFTLDGAAYVMANEASRAETGIPTSQEAKEITRSLYSIIRVCKHWYAVAIQALWSHLKINICADTIKTMEGIQGAIDRDTMLASYVLRITLERFKGEWEIDSEILDEHLQRLTSQLPSLRIFVCPSRYAFGIANSVIDIVVWERFMRPDIYWRILKQAHCILNARILSISLDIDGQALSDWNPVVLPRLESLSIRVDSPQTIEYFTRSWSIPNLHTLSVKSISTTCWPNFIQKWSTNVHTLELVVMKLEYSKQLCLPALKELHIAGRYWMPYRIVAPNVERFCLFWLDASDPTVREDALRAVDHARASFPGLRKLRFRGLEGQPHKGKPFIAQTEPSDYSLTSQDIRSWTEAGLDVDVLLS